MSQAKDLTTHIMNLIRADTTLVSKLDRNWFYTGVPKTVPSIYLDGLFLVDDKIDTWSFNISFVTSDMSLAGLEIAQQVKAALQASRCIVAQGIVVHPEADNNRTRYLIPCSAAMYRLKQ